MKKARKVYVNLFVNATFGWFTNSKCENKRTYYTTLRKMSQLSMVHGPRSHPLLDLSVGDVIRRSAEAFGEREAVVALHQSARKTYAELNDESEGVACGFVELGLEPGDCVGIWSPNSYEWILTQFAAAKAGLVLVNINPAYKSDELKFCVEKVSMKALVFADKFKTSDYLQMVQDAFGNDRDNRSGELQCSRFPALKRLISTADLNSSGVMSLSDVAKLGKRSDGVNSLVNLKPSTSNTVNIQFTSGTTGFPKAAMLSHHNVVNNAYFCGLRLGYDKQHLKICLPVPLFHCFGSVSGVLCGLYHGCSIVLPSAGFDAEAAVDAFFSERVQCCYGTPTMFVDIIKEYQHRRKQTKEEIELRTGIMAGAPCPQKLVEELIREVKVDEFITAYGMTETSPMTFQCHPSDPLSVRSHTVGSVSDWIDAKVVDSNGNTCPVQTEGELLVKGYCNFLGYYKDEAKTSEIFDSDGWLKTGDLAALDTQGHLTIKGRIKDLIIRGGENIYPAEIENVYMSHPEVSEAQVFGVPDERMGEETAMWVRLVPGSTLSGDHLKKWSKEKISHYKIPKYIRICSEFPRTTSGKIQKFQMKKEQMQEMGL